MKYLRPIRFSLPIFTLLLMALQVRTQTLPIERFTAADGLPSNWIVAIYQDSRGHLWLGGDGGLARYDGIGFESFGTEDGLPVPHVWAIQEKINEPGTLLIGTHGGGLTTFRNGQFSSMIPGESDGQDVVGYLAQDSSGTVWCGTNAGLMWVRGDSSELFAGGPGQGSVHLLKLSRDNWLWFGFGAKLYRYHVVQEKLEDLSPLERPVAYRSFLDDRRNNLHWIGTSEGELIRMRDNEVLSVTKISDQPIVDMTEDDMGLLWMITGRHLIKVEKNRFPDVEPVLYTQENGLPNSDFFASSIDREQNIWIGSQEHGLAKLSERNAVHMHLPGMHGNRLQSQAAVDGNGHLWLSAATGFWEVWKQGNVWHKQAHNPPNLSTSGRPYAIEAEPSGKLWVLHDNRFLVQYAVEHFGTGPSRLIQERRLDPPPGSLRRISLDRNNTLWLSGTQIHLAHVDLNSTREKVSYQSIAFPGLEGVTEFSLDPAGNMWIGTFINGAFLLEPDGDRYRVRQAFTEEDGLTNLNVRSILVRNNGEMWFGHRFKGISIYRDGRFSTLSTANGLLNNAVWNMAEDPSGRVWISTSIGVQTTTYADGRDLRTQRSFLGKRHSQVGIIKREQTVFGISPDNITLYEYGVATPQPIPTPINIESFAVNGQPLDLSNEITLGYGENVYEIQYEAVTLNLGESLRYRHNLRGRELSWAGDSKSRRVQYTSLQPGSYQFEVSAINAAGLVSPEPAIVSFTILPPFWQRTWFIAGCGVILAGMLYAIHRIRLHRILAIERIRSRIATDLHDDIGAGLTHIGLLSEVSLQKSARSSGNEIGTETGHDAAKSDAHAELRESVNRIGGIARELSSAMSDVVWSINPRHDSVQALQHRLTAFASEIAEAKEIALKINVPSGIAKMNLNPEVRRNLLLIAKEALHNAVKYSGTPSLELDIQVTNGIVSLEVSDQGVGFDPAESSDGNGLTNMRQRARQVGGRCEIASQPGQGTKVTAFIPTG